MPPGIAFGILEFMQRICVFGDSIAWGAVDPEGGGWVTRLRNHFEAHGQRVDLDIDVYNLGISGDNTKDLSQRYEVEMVARKPDTLIFAIGINDSQYVLSKQSNRIAPAEFRLNMVKMLERAHGQEKAVYILGLTSVDESKTTPIPWNTDKEYRNEYIKEYDRILRELAEQFSARYIDVITLLTPHDLADGLHPNPAGHVKLFEAVKRVLDS